MSNRLFVNSLIGYEKVAPIHFCLGKLVIFDLEQPAAAAAKETSSITTIFELYLIFAFSLCLLCDMLGSETMAAF